MQATSKVIQDEKDCFDKEDTSMRSAVQKNIVFLLTAKASVAFISSRSTLRQALEKMRYHGYTALPVVADDGTYVGTISEGDFLWHILDSGGYTIKSQEGYPVSDIIRYEWNPAVKINMTLDELLLRVKDQNFVPVVYDREKFVGIITRKSVINYYHDLFEKEKFNE